jgi:hypothetical protein
MWGQFDKIQTLNLERISVWDQRYKIHTLHCRNSYGIGPIATRLLDHSDKNFAYFLCGNLKAMKVYKHVLAWCAMRPNFYLACKHSIVILARLRFGHWGMYVHGALRDTFKSNQNSTFPCKLNKLMIKMDIDVHFSFFIWAYQMP